jgi:hypothetical protein
MEARWPVRKCVNDGAGEHGCPYYDVVSEVLPRLVKGLEKALMLLGGSWLSRC